MIITIDGPAGAGKTTAAKILSEKLRFVYLDTGAMYRTVALYILNNNLDIDNLEEIKKTLKKINIKIEKERIFLNEEDVSEKIRTPEIDLLSSKISTIPVVRERMVELQKQYSDKKNIICEGRDMGSIVFPDAEVKFYMDCSLEQRAKRRKKDFEKKNIKKGIEEIKKELEQRDIRDKNRKHSPLVKVEDAILIDTTSLTIDEEIEIMLKYIEEKKR